MSDNNEGHLELALERFARLVATSGAKQSFASVAAAISQVGSTASDKVDTHEVKRQFVHGVGPLYVAKTSSPTQFVRWSEIEGRPDLQTLDFELDADRLVTGKVAYDRLHIAEAGEVSDRLVRANDPRLTGGISFIRKTSESLAAGDWVNIHLVSGEHRVRRATALHPEGAVGFVGQSYGVNEDATVFLLGENAWTNLPVATQGDMGRTVFLSTTAGKCGLTPPGTEGTLIQPIGIIIRVAPPLVSVLVRFELRFQL